MSEPFLGQLLQVGFTFAPQGWAICAGQTLAIAQNSALFALLGTTYGGNGTTTFQLPDFQGRVPIGTGSGAGLAPYVAGQKAGTESVTITTNQMPSHTHAVTVTQMQASSTKATLQQPAAGSVLARGVDNVGTAIPLIYQPAGTALDVTLGGAIGVAIGNTGGSQPTPILQPYLGITTIIALEGIFPSRS